jgi:hypothetical protein
MIIQQPQPLSIKNLSLLQLLPQSLANQRTYSHLMRILDCQLSILYLYQ